MTPNYTKHDTCVIVDNFVEMGDFSKNYPFLFVGKNKIAFVYVDKKYHDEYISAYKTGKIALKTDSLEMFTADELYNTCIELEKIENEFEIRKKQYP